MVKPRIKLMWFGKYFCYDGDTRNNGFGNTPQEAYNDYLKWKQISLKLQRERGPRVSISQWDKSLKNKDYSCIVIPNPDHKESLLTKIKRWFS